MAAKILVSIFIATLFGIHSIKAQGGPTCSVPNEQKKVYSPLLLYYYMFYTLAITIRQFFSWSKQLPRLHFCPLHTVTQQSLNIRYICICVAHTYSITYTHTDCSFLINILCNITGIKRLQDCGHVGTQQPDCLAAGIYQK